MPQIPPATRVDGDLPEVGVDAGEAHRLLVASRARRCSGRSAVRVRTRLETIATTNRISTPLGIGRNGQDCADQGILRDLGKSGVSLK